MNWFKNLNATPRLMSSFGVIIVLILGISALSIYNLGQANDRIGVLYQDDMAGLRQANQIASDRLSLGREVREAILHIQDPAVIAEQQKNMLAHFEDIHSTLDAAEKTFYSPEGKQTIVELRNALPAYENGYREIYELIQTKDVARSLAQMDKVTAIGQPFMQGSARAVEIKEKRADEKFVANLQSYQAARTLMIAASLVSIALALILSLVIARGFSVPLAHAVEVLEKMAGGDLTVSLDLDTKDEVGRMAAALNRTIQNLRETLQEVADSAANATSSSQQLAAASEAIASGAQEQAASLEETSASLEEITAAVRQSADNANQASQLATSSKDSAEIGQQVVSKAITAMAEINAASAKISDIISTIDEIAFQTNLLAVNAAVEAARAGDEGRGFAVVASEVRSLAQRSAVAAKEIKGLIQDSLKKVEAGSELVNRSGETLHGIVGSVKRVTDIVGEIAAASSEQSTGIEQVNTAMTQMDQVTQSNSAQTEELSATAQSLSEQSARLMVLVSTFTLSQGRGSSRDRQSYQLREASPVHSVGASLVQSAKPTLVHSSQPPSIAAQRSAKTSRSAAPAKVNTRSRAGKGATSQQSVLASAAASAQDASDASFEEF